MIKPIPLNVLNLYEIQWIRNSLSFVMHNFTEILLYIGHQREPVLSQIHSRRATKYNTKSEFQPDRSHT